MIISHKHKFAFIKTTKTAGTSVEIALAKHCGDDDIITPIHPDDEKIKVEKGLRGPQNNIVSLEGGKQLQLNNHAPGKRAKRVLGPAKWGEYFTFAFDRNPYDKAVSAFYYVKKNKAARGEPTEHMDFQKWVAKETPIHALHDRGWGLYTQKDELIVDKVYKFEDLDNAMTDIYSRLNISEESKLLQTKTSDRKPTYRELYDDETRKIVATICGKEISEFGYEF